MANPADQFDEVAKSNYVSQNIEGLKDLRELMNFMEKQFRYKAIIKDHDTEIGGQYTVDIYENSYGEDATKIDLDAIALDEPLRYKKDMPCQVIRLQNNLWGIPRPTTFFHFKVTGTYDSGNQSVFIKGIPCNSLGETVLETSLTLDLEYNYPSNQTKKPITGPEADDIVLAMIYDVPLKYDATSTDGNTQPETFSIGLVMSLSNAGVDAIIDMRWNDTTKKIEVKYASDPDTWVPKITFAPVC